MKWTLKAIRTNMGLTQLEMASKLNITKETYMHYENYKTYPNVNIIKKIIKLSNINFDDIIFLLNDNAKSVNNKEEI